MSTIQELIDLLLDGWYSTKANSYEDFKLSDWLRGLFFGTENTR
nr:MAG TPA: oligonucleotide/oligosaccharide-binding protein [Bacteriophage sp.]